MESRLKATLAPPKGFSLVELLTVVAILGVTAGLLLPNMSVLSRTSDVQNQRNAKTLISVTEVARVAGVSLVVKDNLDATVARIMEGAAPATGAFKGRLFKVSGMNEEAAEGAKQYLKVEDEQLKFIPPGAVFTTSS